MQRGQGKTDRAFAATISQLVSAGELGLHVVRDRCVQGSLRVGELVVDGIGAPFGKQARAVETQHVLLDHAAHQVGHVHLVRAVAELAVEAVCIQQRHEELEVLFLTVVGRGRHQQKVAGDGPQRLAKQEALGLVDLVAEVAGRELVGFVHDDQVPLREHELFLQVFGSRQLIDAGDQQVEVVEGVAAAGLLDLLTREQREREAELLEHFVLPLLDQRAGRDDEHALGVGAHQQLADE